MPVLFKKTTVLILLLASLFTLPAYSQEKTQTQKPKYIFLMIGDGMGNEQIKAAEMFKEKTGKGKLVMTGLPVKSLTTTHSSNSPVTDSAASATAIACGFKTNNGVVGMSKDKTRKFESIAFQAKKSGMKVGIISSAPIDHATPACFYANEPSRNSYYNISLQAPASGFSYFAGVPFNGRKKDKNKTLDKTFTEAGYTVYKNRDGLAKIQKGSDRIIWEADMPFVIDSKKEHVSLKELTEKGIEVLDNPKGFFMMVEGAKIDWTGHGNEIAANIYETLAFDEAVAVAYDFYRKHPEDTLIIVTADHETGGLKTDFSGSFSQDEFIKAVKHKIWGGTFSGKIKKWEKEKLTEEEFLKKVTELFGFTSLSETEKNDIKQAIKNKLDSNNKLPPELRKKYGKKKTLVNICKAILNTRCGVSWSTGGHTGAKITTAAIGSGSNYFINDIDNTDIAKKVATIIKQPKVKLTAK